jgi:NAD(P)H-hydrate epimerase
MSRLIGDHVSSIQSDRISVATQASKRWGKIVVLKGAHTIVSTPQGETKISPFANPALASAGTGDVLAGIIAGLMSQNLSPATSASLGVYLHGTAGKMVSDDLGDAGLAASDLLPMLPRAIKKLKSGD